MKEIEFNLLTEPWIRVRLRDNTVRAPFPRIRGGDPMGY